MSERYTVGVQLRSLTTRYAVTVAAVLQTLGLPKVWGCRRNVDVEASLLKYDSM